MENKIIEIIERKIKINDKIKEDICQKFAELNIGQSIILGIQIKIDKTNQGVIINGNQTLKMASLANKIEIEPELYNPNQPDMFEEVK